MSDQSPALSSGQQADSPRGYRITPAQVLYLNEFAKTHSMVKAMKAAGLSSLREVEDWKTADTSVDGYGFRGALAEAQALLADSIESAAYERAVVGWDEPVFQGGEQVGSKRRYSDSLMQTLLEASLPEKYGSKAAASMTLELGLKGGDRGPLPSPQALEEVFEVSMEFGQMLARRVGKRVREEGA